MMQFGLNEKTIEKIRSVLSRHPAIDKVVLYGSRAKGTHKLGSDIDLTMYSDDLSQKEMNQILDEIDSLDLPYIVDLSLFRELTHASLLDHIQRVGIVFYSRKLSR
ncbi:MAG: nucleotidyltransferase domain-containing protein [Solidesulfovibrio sp.]|uniref:nucleotidyltransferase domain-containing protein n=1 Tax=Solidesulfovibrio sp. TaxID=2910990 RepID=UPI0031597943